MGELQELREELGWTRDELAVYLGVSYVTVYRWETGRARPRGLYAQALAELLARHARQPVY